MQFWWFFIYSLMSNVPSPTNGLEFVLDEIKAQNISTLRIFYNSITPLQRTILTTGTATPEGNSPADEFWFLSIGYTPISGAERILSIGFSANGSVDLTRTLTSDYNQATSLLSPLSSFFQTSNNSTTDILGVLNALFVSYYWFILSDLGQSNPTMYANPSQLLAPSNFSDPVAYPASNNPLVNPNLTVSVFSRAGFTGSEEMGMIAETLASGNGTIDLDPTIRRIYLCTVRQLKPILVLIVSVTGVGLSLLSTFYSCGIMGLHKLTKRKEDQIPNTRDECLELVAKPAIPVSRRDIFRSSSL
jgi:hypothetical protein